METEQTQPTFPPLNGKKLLAFEMKFDGDTYQNIAEKTGYSQAYLGKCFKREGKWRAHYDDYEAKRVDEIEKEGRIRIKKRIAEALTVQETLLTMIKTNPREAGKAARDLLDRGGLKAPEKIEVTDPDDHAEKITKWFENKAKTSDNKNE